MATFGNVLEVIPVGHRSLKPPKYQPSPLPKRGDAA